MKNVVQGIPQSIQDGAALSGLSAWHIYPDINVIGLDSKEINLKDEPVSDGGNIILGLEHRKRTSTSVLWSLSLTHLKY